MLRVAPIFIYVKWGNVMTLEEVTAFLEKNYPGQKIKYLGHGSDSAAFRVGTRVFRFTTKGISIYTREADVCNFLRKYITVQIPDIKIVQRDGFQYAVHEMLTGKRWSWHTFQFSPRRQRNLAKTAAGFLAELHSADVDALARVVPDVRNTMPYIKFDLVEKYLRPYMSARQLKRFRQFYEGVVNAPVAQSDMVPVHMGLKGANSVVYPDGRLKGVFDFGNCGIYERWRDLVLFSLSRNARLYKQVLREYQARTGLRPDRRRIRELALIEFLWAKRWYVGDTLIPLKPHAVRRNVGLVLMYFWHVPEFMKPIVRLMINIRERIMR